MGRCSQRQMVACALVAYTILALSTDILDFKETKKDVFRIEKLSLRPMEEIQVVEYQQRKARIKEVCAAWGAYSTKAKFLKTAQKFIGNNKIKDEIIRDRPDLSQSQLERLWQLNKRTTFHQMFVDKEHSLTWCKVPKAASTSWLHAFLQVAGVQDIASKDMAGKHALLRDTYPLLATGLLRRIMPATMKFMVVRHPFERVLSAYRDKLENYERDVKDRGGYYYAIYGKRIVKAYRKPSISEEVNHNARKEPTFREFIQYLLDSDVEEYDEHWRPIFLLCTPCHIKYDVIAKMETLSQDADFILYHRGLADEVHIEWTHKTDQTKRTSDVAKTYFSQLTSSEVKQLYYKFILDFLLFEYEFEPYMKLAATPTVNSSLSVDEESEYYYEDDEEDNEYDDYEEEEEEEEDVEETGDTVDGETDNEYESQAVKETASEKLENEPSDNTI
ncbi:carbohydrate sulfotransferase 11-like [Homarus americanus]|uniref:carbohydrate sulfotransferase 11-like n=1 Tax=Homarus americanus TaxID=6706 RepID=UPI001C46A534|nr:carbohydrate sulfotransferase 11-like [Homarus americanus]